MKNIIVILITLLSTDLLAAPTKSCPYLKGTYSCQWQELVKAADLEIGQVEGGTDFQLLMPQFDLIGDSPKGRFEPVEFKADQVPYINRFANGETKIISYCDTNGKVTYLKNDKTVDLITENLVVFEPKGNDLLITKAKRTRTAKNSAVLNSSKEIIDCVKVAGPNSSPSSNSASK